MAQSPTDALLQSPISSYDAEVEEVDGAESIKEEQEVENGYEAGLKAASGTMASASSFMLPRSASSAVAAAALPRLKILAFGLGHVLNDMCASCWFTYLLVLMHKVLGFSSWKSACILLSGQVADAIATPLVGIYSDKSKGLTCGSFYFGRRHLWYTIGTALVFVNFFFLFGICALCVMSRGHMNTNSDANLAYYSISAALFNVGWASVQVSHMSLVPELTADTPTRVLLNSVRYSATVASNLFVFLVLALLIYVWKLDDQAQFRVLAYVALGVGSITSLIFLMGTEEQRPINEQIQHEENLRRKASNAQQQQQQHRHDLNYQQLDNETVSSSSSSATNAVRTGGGIQTSQVVVAPISGDNNNSGDEDEDNSMGQEVTLSDSPPPAGDVRVNMAAPPPPPPRVGSSHCFEDTLTVRLQSLPVVFRSYRCWMRMSEFYICGTIYMCARIVTNVSQVFLPFFILDVCKLDTIYITILPCVTYVSSMVAAGWMQKLNRVFGRKLVFILGFCLVSAGLAGLFFLPSEAPLVWLIYPCCVLIGLGNGTIMVCCTQLTSDLIGSRTNYAAFVFGSFSFTDKASNGILLFALQSYNNDSAEYIRYVVTLPAIGAALLATMVILTKVDLEEWKRKHTLPSRRLLTPHKKSAAEVNEH